MIRPSRMLLRHAQEFFLTHMIGVYDWGEVQVDPPDLCPPAERRERGIGKYQEKERLTFGPWEILIYSSHERPPLGEISLREGNFGGVILSGPLDPATWAKIGQHIRNASLRKAL